MAELKDSSVIMSPELSAIATRELNETPSVRRAALIEMKQILHSDDESKDNEKEESVYDYDESLLIRCLRCKKFDVQRAVLVYQGYKSYSVTHIWDSGLLGALKSRDKHGRAVMISFPGQWDPESHALEDVLKSMILQLEHLIESVETQVNGIVLIADFKDFTLYQARCIRPWFFQMMSSLVQNAFPARFKGVYVLNQPWYISLLMAVISRLLSDKMNSRIHMLGDNYEELENNFNMDDLPEDFGGRGQPYEGSEWSAVMNSTENKHQTTPTLISETTPKLINETTPSFNMTKVQ